MVGWLVDRFASIDPHVRRRVAGHLLVWSFLLGHLNLGAFVLGFIPPNVMDAITNYLSWLALTVTALDVLVTADVRAEVDDS